MIAIEVQLKRIADSLEEIAEIMRPKPVDMTAVLAEAVEAMKQTNPAMKLAFDAMDRQAEKMKLAAGEEENDDAPSTR